MKIYSIILIFLLWSSLMNGQRRASGRDESKGIFVDKQGVMRWKSNNEEAAFFGVNYTVPFAYGYRSHKALGITPETGIIQDVYHFSRLGLDAFRVHMWDTEITDSVGNLLNNEHLRLFDFLLAELKKYNIKTIITPIAFWGNGYPEPDIKTGSFSSKYPKRIALVNDTAILAQENYLRQLMKHVNPYTKLTYENDPDIIAGEINNEPHHSGPKAKVTEYINRMVTAMRRNGWTKPIFYNISESPAYADAVSQSNIQGVSFQWYPTGLVANRSLKGNHLPHVDVYRIPFGDTIPEYRNKARMVYEFDAGDIPDSYMYPAIARSYRTAGFQWATQFAYDPLVTAYGNTEYQTHYLNFIYTPSKAISLMIAGKAFHRLPRNKSYGTYPSDTLFDVFRVSYSQNLSEMNSEEEFYYSNSTTSKPLNPQKLKHIAGIGNSPVIEYNGNGTYFLDKQENGDWKLDIMPDAISLSDPFERTSPSKAVTVSIPNRNRMKLNLPGFPNKFSFRTSDTSKRMKSVIVNGDHLLIEFGTYLLRSNGGITEISERNEELPIYAVPQPNRNEIYVINNSSREFSQGISMSLNVKMVRIDSTDKIFLDIRHSTSNWQELVMQKHSENDYYWVVPAGMVVPGIITYRVIIQKANGDYITFPGNHKENPWSWENAYKAEYWETRIVPAMSPLVLFNADKDRNRIMIYNPDWRSNSIQYIPSSTPGALVVKARMSNPGQNRFMGWQYYVGDNIEGRRMELPVYNTLVVKASSIGAEPTTIHVTLITKDARAFSADIKADQELKEIAIPISMLKADSMLLLPRPYPGFHPLYFKSSSTAQFDLKDIEKIEITFGRDAPVGNPISVEIESIYLRRD